MGACSLFHQNVISMSSFSKEKIENVLEKAHAMKTKEHEALLQGKIIASCFFEPSTRTRLSFEAAALRLGARILSITDAKTTSSGQKGETLTDSMRVIGSYSDLIVLRHPQEGAARCASEAVDVPVINAGDGANQHPTQTLLDLFTIQECQGKIDGLNIAFVGDLKHGRTVHSLAQALSHYNARLYFVGPETFSMPGEICHYLRSKGVRFSFHQNLSEVMPQLDVIYMTRLQQERIQEGFVGDMLPSVSLHAKDLIHVKENLRILHPLPRREELAVDVDQTPYAYYFEQAKNGLYVRQALLSLLLLKEG